MQRPRLNKPTAIRAPERLPPKRAFPARAVRKQTMPKIIDHDQRRRDIIEVAKRLILQGGFEAATMRSIAAEAGFANGALKHYFPGKESIIAATFESVLAEIDPRGPRNEDLRRPGQDAIESLREAIMIWMPMDERQINYGRVLLVFWEHAVSNPELAESYRPFFARWGEMIVRLLQAVRAEARALTDAEYDRMALEMRSMVIGANVVNLLHPDARYVETYARYIEDFIERATAP